MPTIRACGLQAGALMPGTPSCATEWRMWPTGAADQLNMRVVAVDRPGLGCSDPLPRRHIADWLADVTALADALGLSRFAILGYSGAVPYALSCAEALPDRVSKAALVGCVGPGNIAGMAPAVARSRQMCLHRPRRARITWWGVRLAARRFPGRLIDQTLQALPEPDRRTLADPEFARVYTDVLSDTLDAGPAGACRDMALMTGGLGIAPRPHPHPGDPVARRPGRERPAPDGPATCRHDPWLRCSVLLRRRALVDHHQPRPPDPGRSRPGRAVTSKRPVAELALHCSRDHSTVGQLIRSLRDHRR